MRIHPVVVTAGLHAIRGFAALGVVLSLATHTATFLGEPPAWIYYAWPLHVGALATFIPLVVLAKGGHIESGGEGESPVSLSGPFRSAPRWAFWLFALFFAYALLNFVVNFVGFAIEAPKYTERDGRYFRVDGRVEPEPVTESEYRRHEALVLRGFSGHWMLFFWAAAAGAHEGLVYRRRQAGNTRAQVPVIPREP